MAQIEELELDAHRAQLNSDVRSLADKYRAIFGWNVPEVDEALSQRRPVRPRPAPRRS